MRTRPCKGHQVSSTLLCTYLPSTWDGPQSRSSRTKGTPPPILDPLFHFQEEPKEEQTAMVPQAIPLRRCRYCLVLVGDVHILLWKEPGPSSESLPWRPSTLALPLLQEGLPNLGPDCGLQSSQNALGEPALSLDSPLCPQQPLRARHCRDCRRCVRRYDHHCPWMENCVGERNHPLFVAYLALQLVVLLWGLYLAW